MGYYSNFNLDWINADYGLVGNWISYHPEFEWALHHDGTCKDASKWYDYEDDLIALSFAFPEGTFKLTREGEENGDAEIIYARNGISISYKAEYKIQAFDMETFTELPELIKYEGVYH